MAVTDRSKGNKGISAFIVELDNPGIRVGKKENKLGMRASDTCTLVMEDCRVPAGEPARRARLGFRGLDEDPGRRPHLDRGAVGRPRARRVRGGARAIRSERKQFGKAISEFQAIQFKLAEMATEIDAARLLTERAAAAKDAGQTVTKLSAMAKLYASEIAVRATDRAIQIYGGYGFTQGLPGREVLPRRQALHDRRGHERDPAARHRASSCWAAREPGLGRGVRGARPRRPRGDGAPDRPRDLRGRARLGNGPRHPAPPLPAHRAARGSSASRDLPAPASRRSSSGWRRPTAKQGRRVGIVAVDPSSPFTGGAILGDRIRMAEIYTRSRRLHPLDGHARRPRRPRPRDERRRRRARRRRVRRRS